MNPVRTVNHIFVIQSLPAGDARTGEVLYHDVVRREIDVLDAAAHKMTHEYFNVNDRNGFNHAMGYIQANAPYFFGGVLVHLETHGDENKEGLVLSNGSLVSWKELVDLFRPINIATCNKLFVSMATCHGRELWRGIDPFTFEKSPYQAYISASREVYPDETAKSFQSLFKMLINDGDLIAAYLEHEKGGSPFVYKDSETTFEDTVKTVREGIDTDPEYRQRILDHPVLQEFLQGGPQANEIMDEIMKKAFNSVVRKHADTFNFSDCN